MHLPMVIHVLYIFMILVLMVIKYYSKLKKLDNNWQNIKYVIIILYAHK